MQFYANEFNKGRETLTPNPNVWNSTLTSGTENIYPYPYILMLMSRVIDEGRGHRLRILYAPGHDGTPPPSPHRRFLITFISRKLISDHYLSMEYVFSHHPQVFLFMQYVILRVALHEVLIVIALGHVKANVKSFEKKIKMIFKIIISKQFQTKKKSKLRK